MLIVHMLLKSCFNMGVLGPLNFNTVDLLITSKYCLYKTDINEKSIHLSTVICLTGPPSFKILKHDRFVK